MVYYDIVEKHSKWYSFLRKIVSFFFSYIYYRRFYITGRENVPPSGTSVIIVSNHQNGLIDALCIIFGLPSSITPIFMARADIFKKSKVAKILNFLKILPVFRQRDGREHLEENDELFDFASNMVGGGFVICLFPEGQHQEGHYIGQMKKGFARVAFSAAEKKSFPSDMVILPVANHYKSYSAWRTEVELCFAKPIVLADYYDLYRENPVRAMVELTSKVQSSIGSIMLDMPYKERYAEMDKWRELARDPYCGDLIAMKNADKQWAEAVSLMPQEKVEEMCQQAKDLNAELHSKGFTEKEWPVQNTYSDLLTKALCIVLYSPFAFFGWIFHILPLAIINKIVKKITVSVKSKMLYTTFHFVLDLIVTTVTYILYMILFAVILRLQWWVYIELIVLLLLLRVAYKEYSIFARSFVRQCRAFKHRKDKIFADKIYNFRLETTALNSPETNS